MSINTQSKRTRLDNTLIHKGLYIFKWSDSKIYNCKMFIGNRKYKIKSTGTKLKSEARKIAEEIYQEFKSDNILGVNKSNEFNIYCDRLLDIAKSKVNSGTRKSTHLKDIRIWIEKENGIRDYFGSKDITKITSSDIRNFFDYINEGREKPYTHSSMNKFNVIIKKIMGLGVESGVIQTVPSFTIELNKTQNRDNPRISFTEKEYKLFLDTLKKCIEEEDFIKGNQITLEHYYLVVFQVSTFLRPTHSELFGLRYKDISLNESKDVKSLKLRVVGKTGFRVVDSMSYAVDYLEKLKELNPDYKEDDFLFFPQYKNRTTAIRSWAMIFTHITEKCNLKYVDFEMINQNGSIETIKQPRTPYSLRHYSLQIRLIKSKGKINVYLFARNAGTSVEQLERFYLKHLDTNDVIVKNLQSF